MSHQHAHDHAHDHGDDHGDDHGEVDVASMFTRDYWDERYAGSTRVWSGNPNPRLVEQVADLEPGRALDVGCGEGADVVWLGRQGWDVTGIDVSQVALDRAAAHAAEEGVAEQTTWSRIDVVAGETLPGDMDLVSAQFMHPPLDLFEQVYGAVLDAVRPGGVLLVVGHHPADAPTGLRNPGLTQLLFTPEKVVALLDPATWDLVVAEGQTREVTDAEGATVTLTDTVVRAQRRLSANSQVRQER